MRICTSPPSVEFDLLSQLDQASSIVVFLNGVQQSNVIVADEEAKYVECYMTNADGKFIRNALSGNLVIFRLQGDVKIRFKPSLPWIVETFPDRLVKSGSAPV